MLIAIGQTFTQQGPFARVVVGVAVYFAFTADTTFLIGRTLIPRTVTIILTVIAKTSTTEGITIGIVKRRYRVTTFISIACIFAASA